ncbi:MAG TPA: hypothetical protein DIC60_04190 [Lachnospiraceae bacterium]|nr:hypothetical protein [Lachnospiraceae bacterium]
MATINGNVTTTQATTQGYIEALVVKDAFETAIKSLVNAKNLFTTKNTLQGVDGDLIRKITYTYEGGVVDADTGAVVPSEQRGKLSYKTQEIRIKPFKQAFDVTDKEKRQNSNVLSMNAQGNAEVTYNFINDSFYTALRTITKAQEYTTFNWDAVEDALATLNLESREGMFLLVSPKMYSQLKKSTEVKSANNGEIIFSGQVKTVDGLSIVISNKLADDEAIIASKDTVVYECKKDATVTTDVYNELEKETFVTKFAGIVYLDNEKKAIKLTKTV